MSASAPGARRGEPQLVAQRRTIRRVPGPSGVRGDAVEIIDQTALPHACVTRVLDRVGDVVEAIATMRVRGAPLIGVTGAYGMAIAASTDPSDGALGRAAARLVDTRPTAVNLAWAVGRVRERLRALAPAERAAHAWEQADAIAADDVARSAAMGKHGAAILAELAAADPDPARPLNVLTHCNAGWLAAVEWGTALAPVYVAANAGVPVHVWVGETRPRNQGAALTAWELGRAGVPHTVVVDNAGGHLMAQGLVDVVFVGSDRVAANGDVVNKIGTYLKALAARDTGVPFYAVLPGSTIDWEAPEGAAIPIEARAADEVATIRGRTDGGEIASVRLVPDETPVANPAFDVTPARLVTGIVTERGVCPATPEGLATLYADGAAG